jgi:PAS domain S-box-containing protein
MSEANRASDHPPPQTADPQRDFRALFEATSDAVLVIDLQSGHILEASPGAVEILERPADRLREMTVWDLASPEDRDTIHALIEVTANEGRVDREVGLHFPSPTGELVPSRARVKAIRRGPGPEALILIQDLTALTDAQQRLEDAETRHRAVFETASDPIFLIGPDGVFLDGNPAAARAQGLSPEELVGKHMRDLFPEPIADRQLRSIMHIFETARPMHDQEALTHTVEGPRWFNTSLAPVKGPEGKVRYVVGMARDITDRKKAEEALREAVQEKSLILSSVSEHVLYRSPDMEIIWGNRAAAESLGLEPHELVGRSCYDAWHGRKGICPGCPVKKALDAGRPATGEITTPDGRVWYVSGYPVFGANGHVAGAVEVTHDITDRKRAEEALRESEQRYRAVVESQTELVTRFRPDGTVTFVNEANCRYFGLTREEFTSGPLRRLLFPEDYERLMEALASLTPSNPTFQIEHRIRRGDEIRWTQWTNQAFFDEEGRVVEYQGVGRDITERKQLEERLREAQKMEAVGQLAGGIAHDFNNLMTGVLCQVDLLKRYAGSGSPAAAAADAIEGAAQRAAHRTSQLLGFARRGKLQNVPVDLGTLIGEVINLVDTGKDAIVKPKRIEAEQPVVMGDPEQLEQVILNLALNARDAMPDGGEMAFEIRRVEVDDDHARNRPDARPGRYVRLTVSDTGCGIEPDHLGRIFEPFFTTKAHGQGTGMGLATVYGIVRNHGGWIEVDSEPGRGSEFRLYLPPAEGSRSAEPGEPVAAGPAAGQQPRAPDAPAARILVVDDEGIVRRALDRMLRDAGYEVVTASDGPEAVAWYGENPGGIDLAIIDMRMPEMDGRECFQALRRINAEVRAIFSTGFEVEAVVRAALEDGMVGFVRKPFKLHELTEAVAAALQR